ncbi:unnamed protein product [Cylicostephanus goldi]|uniref:Uncharacterized protein n=1 Tax=Cylicostephanus goldi TaxID=71465 RepID=A0A3P6RR56_CYLGO|nr:unnamed protein product [Cylicostephanus goldi]
MATQNTYSSINGKMKQFSKEEEFVRLFLQAPLRSNPFCYKVCQILVEIHGQAKYSFIHMSCLKQYGAVELKTLIGLSNSLMVLKR